MEKLLAQYSISQIIIFIVLLAGAIKSCCDFIDWATEKVKNKFNKQNAANKSENQIKQQLNLQEQAIKTVTEKQLELSKTLSTVEDKINLLIDSDKDDIKSFLTREHHYFCYQRGWIDDYSLECCQKRFEHYQKQGGNSFILGFMKQLRALPKHPPETLIGEKEINQDATSR